MSDHHLIGIDHEGKLQSLISSDTAEPLLKYAEGAKVRFARMFLISQRHNVRELTFGVAIGPYAPVVADTEVGF